MKHFKTLKTKQEALKAIKSCKMVLANVKIFNNDMAFMQISKTEATRIYNSVGIEEDMQEILLTENNLLLIG